MHWIVEEVPWGNLWRTIVTTLLFASLIGVPVALIAEFDTGPSATLFVQTVFVIAFVLATIVVWSDRIVWIGDP